MTNYKKQLTESVLKEHNSKYIKYGSKKSHGLNLPNGIYSYSHGKLMSGSPYLGSHGNTKNVSHSLRNLYHHSSNNNHNRNGVQPRYPYHPNHNNHGNNNHGGNNNGNNGNIHGPHFINPNHNNIKHQNNHVNSYLNNKVIQYKFEKQITHDFYTDDDSNSDIKSIGTAQFVKHPKLVSNEFKPFQLMIWLCGTVKYTSSQHLNNGISLNNHNNHNHNNNLLHPYHNSPQIYNQHSPMMHPMQLINRQIIRDRKIIQSNHTGSTNDSNVSSNNNNNNSNSNKNSSKNNNDNNNNIPYGNPVQNDKQYIIKQRMNIHPHLNNPVLQNVRKQQYLKQLAIEQNRAINIHHTQNNHYNVNKKSQMHQPIMTLPAIIPVPYHVSRK